MADKPSAGWVAVVPSETSADRVVGFVDVVDGAPVLEMPSDMPLAQEWGSRTDIAHLTRLSVDSDFWRRGLGSSLIQAVVERCRERKYAILVLNTTSPQLPAMSLYRKVGFREAGRSYLGRYELVWFELAL
jgi:ribosomal protein S18 acetylase RimI-like enzyme